MFRNETEPKYHIYYIIVLQLPHYPGKSNKLTMSRLIPFSIEVKLIKFLSYSHDPIIKHTDVYSVLFSNALIMCILKSL